MAGARAKPTTQIPGEPTPAAVESGPLETIEGPVASEATTAEGATNAPAAENAATVSESPAAADPEAQASDVIEDRNSDLHEITPELVEQARKILAAHEAGEVFVNLSAPMVEGAAAKPATAAASDDKFDENGIAHAAKGRTPTPKEVDPKRIKRPVMTTEGYVVPDNPQPHPAHRF